MSEKEKKHATQKEESRYKGQKVKKKEGFFKTCVASTGEILKTVQT